MSSEETPLLAPEPTTDTRGSETVYDRFSVPRKRVIVALVSWCGLIPFLISGSFTPSIPQIAQDLESTGPIVSLAISLSIFAASIGSLFWATYSGFYGRRPIYLCGAPLLSIGSLGVGLSRSIPQLMIWRFLQAFGGSTGLSVGAGVIGDIYKLEERGTAIGVFFAACLFGLPLAPMVGGLATYYATWRVTQFGLCISGIIAFIAMLLCFPETSHPNCRGIDKLRSANNGTQPRWKIAFLNPFRSLWLLRSPNLFAVALADFTVLLTDFVLLVPLPYTIGTRYHIGNAALIGACFLPSGFGAIIGAPVGGRISDKIIVKWRKRRGGKWVPEDRLRPTLLAISLLVPLSVLFSGLITQFVEGKIGLVLNLLCLFINGFGVDMVLGPSAAYAIDVLHTRSAESLAANRCFRTFFVSLAVSGILPLINLIGVAATNALAASLVWVGFGFMWCTIRYGDRMRAWVDVGYSIAEDN